MSDQGEGPVRLCFTETWWCPPCSRTHRRLVYENGAAVEPLCPWTEPFKPEFVLYNERNLVPAEAVTGLGEDYSAKRWLRKETAKTLIVVALVGVAIGVVFSLVGTFTGWY